MTARESTAAPCTRASEARPARYPHARDSRYSSCDRRWRKSNPPLPDDYRATLVKH
jgi:hypothetical protein